MRQWAATSAVDLCRCALPIRACSPLVVAAAAQVRRRREAVRGQHDADGSGCRVPRWGGQRRDGVADGVLVQRPRPERPGLPAREYQHSWWGVDRGVTAERPFQNAPPSLGGAGGGSAHRPLVVPAMMQCAGPPLTLPVSGGGRRIRIGHRRLPGMIREKSCGNSGLRIKSAPRVGCVVQSVDRASSIPEI